MPEREKVIKGPEECTRSEKTRCFHDLHECPYEGYGCRFQMEVDALALLKEQEPWVMTLDEVKAFDWDYCYLEEERLPGKEYRSVCGDYALTCITWPCIASMRIQHGDDNYGKKWRCWSAKPTDEQRKAVKWND